jgi:hypothetical protein
MLRSRLWLWLLPLLFSGTILPRTIASTMFSMNSMEEHRPMRDRYVIDA